MPEYCGIYETDKTIATALENCSKEERIFVYDIIRQNFLKENTSSLTEEERQANISLGMMKAQYAAENFIPEEQKQAFLDAMETIAKIAGAGTADKNGNMHYGVKQASYLGHGSGLVEVTNDMDVMRTMDPAAYEEYQRIGAESSKEDRALNQLKYLTNWYNKMVKKNPHMFDEYEKKTIDYMEKHVKDQKIDTTFKNIDISSKENFLKSIRDFMEQHKNFMTGILDAELLNRFWMN